MAFVLAKTLGPAIDTLIRERFEVDVREAGVSTP